MPPFGGMILTKPKASSDLHAAPLEATAIGVSARLKTLGLRSEVLRMKFDASSTASICTSAEAFCGGSVVRLPPTGVVAAAAAGFDASLTEKSPALAMPCCFTTATQFANAGSNAAV